jgi:hypothetical protein
MKQLIDCLNKHELIEAVKVDEEVFRDWDSFLGRLYTAIPPGMVTQYQYFHSFGWQEGWFMGQVSSALSAEGVKVDLRNPKMSTEERQKILRQTPFDVSTIPMLKAPGVRAIKQVEMYEKWRKFIPNEHLSDLYKKPETTTIAELKEQRRKKKELVQDNREEEETTAVLVAVATKPQAKKRVRKSQAGKATIPNRKTTSRKKKG